MNISQIKTKALLTKHDILLQNAYRPSVVCDNWKEIKKKHPSSDKELKLESHPVLIESSEKLKT